MKGKHVGNCYETIEALLNEVSSSFPFSFASAVAEKLKKINKQVVFQERTFNALFLNKVQIFQN